MSYSATSCKVYRKVRQNLIMIPKFSVVVQRNLIVSKKMLKIIELTRFFIECFLKVQILSLGIRLKILNRERETYLGN